MYYHYLLINSNYVLIIFTSKPKGVTNVVNHMVEMN